MKLTKAQRLLLVLMNTGAPLTHSRDGDHCWLPGPVYIAPRLISFDELHDLRKRGFIDDAPTEDDDGMRRAPPEIITDAGRRALEGGDG